MNEPFPQIVFTAPGRAELAQAAPSDLPPGAALIETECSMVSPGTELACLAGSESWAPLPFRPGYGSVGRLVRAGSESGDLPVGARVFTYGLHARYSPVQTLCLPVPEGLDPARAAFARIAAVSITALRVADAALGDVVAVVGLGPVGNLAAQLFALAGCEVVGIDLSERRRALALECGIPHAFAPGPDLGGKIAALTGGKRCRTVVEATGVPAVAEEAIALAGKNGELVLLGSPRGSHPADLSRFLNRIHLWGEGCVTVKGAHEWRFPVREDEHGRHSMEGNARVLLRLLAEGRLRVDPLLTHRAAPSSCQEIYDGLRREKDRYLGVVFDWTRAAEKISG